VGFGNGKITAKKKAAKGYLIINNMAEPSGLNPQTITGLRESHIISALFKGLINYGPKDLPALSSLSRVVRWRPWAVGP
jgi:hypothetical protein